MRVTIRSMLKQDELFQGAKLENNQNMADSPVSIRRYLRNTIRVGEVGM